MSNDTIFDLLNYLIDKHMDDYGALETIRTLKDAGATEDDCLELTFHPSDVDSVFHSDEGDQQ